MKYPNNDLWSVRQIEFLHDALVGYENKNAVYYPKMKTTLTIPGIAEYTYEGVLYFPGQDRTIIFEQGEGFGLDESTVRAYLDEKNIQVQVTN